MNVKCEAENYNYKIINDKVVFYNEFYNNGLLKLFLGTFEDLCLPILIYYTTNISCEISTDFYI